MVSDSFLFLLAFFQDFSNICCTEISHRGSHGSLDVAVSMASLFTCEPLAIIGSSRFCLIVHDMISAGGIINNLKLCKWIPA